MVLVQKRPVFNLFSLGNLGQENMFYNILNGKKKNIFLRYKNKKFEKWKIEIFSKGLLHDFGTKLANIPWFFLSQSKRGKCVLCDSKLKQKNTFPRYKNKKLKRSKN